MVKKAAKTVLAMHQTITALKTFLLVFLFIQSSIVCAQEQKLPWLDVIDPNNTAHTMQTISTHAAVTVSDGKQYQTNTVFHDKQRAVFQQIYPDRTVSRGLEGRYVWSYDGKVESEAQPMVEDFILGHQFHAQILFFDRLHPVSDKPQADTFGGKSCLVLASREGNTSYKCFYEKSGYPLGMLINTDGQNAIVFKFDDWRMVSSLHLPFAVQIDDGRRLFQYRFENIELNTGSLAEYRAPDSVLTEEQKLLRLHRTIMDGHFFGETAEMKRQQPDSILIVSEGELFNAAGNQPNSVLDRILASRDYTVYDDLVRPLAKVSDDGSLGWVIAQIYAKGVRFDEAGQPTGPLEFVCAWIELYEKINGQWKMTGIVSNFQPGRE